MLFVVVQKECLGVEWTAKQDKLVQKEIKRKNNAENR